MHCYNVTFYCLCVLLCTQLLLCLYKNFSRNLVYVCIINIYNPIVFFIGGTGTVNFYTQ